MLRASVLLIGNLNRFILPLCEPLRSFIFHIFSLALFSLVIAYGNRSKMINMRKKKNVSRLFFTPQRSQIKFIGNAVSTHKPTHKCLKKLRNEYVACGTLFRKSCFVQSKFILFFFFAPFSCYFIKYNGIQCTLQSRLCKFSKEFVQTNEADKMKFCTSNVAFRNTFFKTGKTFEERLYFDLKVRCS